MEGVLHRAGLACAGNAGRHSSCRLLPGGRFSSGAPLPPPPSPPFPAYQFAAQMLLQQLPVARFRGKSIIDILAQMSIQQLEGKCADSGLGFAT